MDENTKLLSKFNCEYAIKIVNFNNKLLKYYKGARIKWSIIYRNCILSTCL